MKLKPAGDRLLVEVDIQEEKTEGGIILAKSVLDKDKIHAQTGTVLALGPLCVVELGDHVLDIGDKIEFPRYAGMVTEGPEKDKLYRLLFDVDVSALIEED